MSADDGSLRLAQYLALCGIASRRNAGPLVDAGRVRVNGAITRDHSVRVVPGRDAVEFDGRPIAPAAAAKIVLAMNKPTGVVVTRHDPDGRPTVYDILPIRFAPHAGGLVYAGRLDIDTSGLLILTTDGDLANRLVHPRFEHEKTYEAKLNRVLSARELEQFRAGLDLGDFRTQPCRARMVHRGRIPICEVVLKEGKNRQVRRMFEALGAQVVGLRRTAIGTLRLESLGIAEGDVCEVDRELLDTATPAAAEAPPGT